jgi:hypothetical protein
MRYIAREAFRTSLIIKGPGSVSKQRLLKVLKLNIESNSGNEFPNQCILRSMKRRRKKKNVTLEITSST